MAFLLSMDIIVLDLLLQRQVKSWAHFIILNGWETINFFLPICLFSYQAPFCAACLQPDKAEIIIIRSSWNLVWCFLPSCSNVVIRYVTILAPLDSPNTDGIDPGTCSFFKVVICICWSLVLFLNLMTYTRAEL